MSSGFIFAPMLVSVGLRPFQIVSVCTFAVINLPKEHGVNVLFDAPAFAMTAPTDRLIRMPKQQDNVEPLAGC